VGEPAVAPALRLAGREVVIDPDATPLRLDDSGLAHARPALGRGGLGASSATSRRRPRCSRRRSTSPRTTR
jgi:hypothetical protein